MSAKPTTDGMTATMSVGHVSDWQCTGEVRFQRRYGTVDVEGKPVRSGWFTEHLQQRWVRLDAPGEEWRDVPTVEG